MRIDLMTLFVDMCESVMNESILGRAQAKGVLEVYCHNIRDYTIDRQKRVDDAPFGGGMGMVMQAQPIGDCFAEICRQTGQRPYLVYMSPQGQVMTQQKAVALSKLPFLTILCGHYEGVDERLLQELVDEELSVGDFVLTGGELPGLMLADAVARLTPGVLREDQCFTEESHFDGLLEYPHYSRPREWNGIQTPDVLLSGHHENIRRWRRRQMLWRTLEKRPDMLETACLNDEDRKILAEIGVELTAHQQTIDRLLAENSVSKE